jgi:hypothetical protein
MTFDIEQRGLQIEDIRDVSSRYQSAIMTVTESSFIKKKREEGEKRGRGGEWKKRHRDPPQWGHENAWGSSGKCVSG